MNELKHPSQEWDLEDIVDINKLKEDFDNYEHPIYDSADSDTFSNRATYAPASPYSPSDYKKHINKKKFDLLSQLDSIQLKLQPGKKQKTKKSSFLSRPSKKKTLRFSQNKPTVAFVEHDPSRGRTEDYSIELENNKPGSSLLQDGFQLKRKEMLLKRLKETEPSQRHAFKQESLEEYNKSIRESDKIIKEMAEKKSGGSKKNKSKCTKSHPEPPCATNKYPKTKIYKDGTKSVCCYNKPSDSAKCTNRNPDPPCKPGYKEKNKQTKNSTIPVKCCYKSDIKKEKKVKPDKSESSVFSVNDTLMEFDPQFEIRKDSDIKKILSKYPGGVLVSNKYDGHRMMFEVNNKVAYSRTGKTSFNLPQNWIDALSESDYSLDGEIFLPGLPASQVASLRTSTNISDILWKNVAEYHIFDLPMHKGVYSERIAKYNEIVNKICKKWNENNKTSCPIKAVQHKLFKTEESVKSFFKDTMKKKFLCPIEIPDLQIEKNCRSPSAVASEGIVLSAPNGLYEFKRSDKKIKYKSRYDYECIVIEPHPLKQSLKCYRKDCPPPPNKNASIFYLSTDSQPKELFKPGELLKYTCLGFSKGVDTCPNKPKMPKFLDWRSEELSTQKQKVKLPPPPTNGPNEELAKYFIEVANGYYKLNQTLKALAYRKYSSITRRTLVKINLDNYFEIYGKNTSFGKQAKCFLEKNSFKTCVQNRLQGLELEENGIKRDLVAEAKKAALKKDKELAKEAVKAAKIAIKERIAKEKEYIKKDISLAKESVKMAKKAIKERIAKEKIALKQKKAAAKAAKSVKSKKVGGINNSGTRRVLRRISGKMTHKKVF